jgi:hypothetical protein
MSTYLKHLGINVPVDQFLHIKQNPDLQPIPEDWEQLHPTNHYPDPLEALIEAEEQGFFTFHNTMEK